MMPNLLGFDPITVLGFLIVLARVTGLILSAPVLGDPNIPITVKAALAFVTTLIFYPVVAAPDIGANPDLLRLILLIIGEVAVGVFLGFTARVLFFGVQLAGEVIGFQMGLGVANVFDPSSDAQIALLGQIQATLALFLFVVVDGHHILIRAVAESYRVIAPGGLRITEASYHYAVSLFGMVFLIGIQIGAPLIVAMLAANFSIGLIARSVPQVNIFIVGFPFTIALGILFLALSFPFVARALLQLHERLSEMMVNGIRALG